jgi:DNA-binding transcriptional regulator YdaS (Cro superfamily)
MPSDYLDDYGFIQQPGIKKAVALAGSQEALGARLGVSQCAVWKWIKQGYCPPRRAKVIEQVYGIPKHELINPELLAFLVDRQAS